MLEWLLLGQRSLVLNVQKRASTPLKPFTKQSKKNNAELMKMKVTLTNTDWDKPLHVIGVYYHECNLIPNITSWLDKSNIPHSYFRWIREDSRRAILDFGAKNQFIVVNKLK